MNRSNRSANAKRQNENNYSLTLATVSCVFLTIFSLHLSYTYHLSQVIEPYKKTFFSVEAHATSLIAKITSSITQQCRVQRRLEEEQDRRSVANYISIKQVTANKTKF